VLSFLKFCRPISSLHINIKRSNEENCLVDMPSLFNNSICAFLAFENSMVHMEFQGRQLPERLIPDKHECIYFAQLDTAWDTAMTFCNSTNFLQCGRTLA